MDNYDYDASIFLDSPPYQILGNVVYDFLSIDVFPERSEAITKAILVGHSYALPEVRVVDRHRNTVWRAVFSKN